MLGRSTTEGRGDGHAGLGSAGTPGTIAEGDYRIVTLVKVKPNMGSEFISFVSGQQQAVLQVRAANGEFKNWSAWTRAFPAGAVKLRAKGASRP